MRSSTDLTGEVQQFFEAFSNAFIEFDGTLIAQRYSTPYTALNAQGTLQVFDTQDKIGLYFQGFLDKYHQQGCRSCRFKELVVVKLGEMSALASVTWELLSSNQNIASTWRESYNLMRSDDELKIFASTDHVDVE